MREGEGRGLVGTPIRVFFCSTVLYLNWMYLRCIRINLRGKGRGLVDRDMREGEGRGLVGWLVHPFMFSFVVLYQKWMYLRCMRINLRVGCRAHTTQMILP